MVGTPGGTRTPNNQLRRLALFQLSYGSVMVQTRGFEPLTPVESGQCSTAELRLHIITSGYTGRNDNNGGDVCENSRSHHTSSLDEANIGNHSNCDMGDMGTYLFPYSWRGLGSPWIIIANDTQKILTFVGHIRHHWHWLGDLNPPIRDPQSRVLPLH